eukprot:scpid13712/ scgid23305/ 
MCYRSAGHVRAEASPRVFVSVLPKQLDSKLGPSELCVPRCDSCVPEASYQKTSDPCSAMLRMLGRIDDASFIQLQLLLAINRERISRRIRPSVKASARCPELSCCAPRKNCAECGSPRCQGSELGKEHTLTLRERSRHKELWKKATLRLALIFLRNSHHVADWWW